MSKVSGTATAQVRPETPLSAALGRQAAATSASVVLRAGYGSGLYASKDTTIAKDAGKGVENAVGQFSARPISKGPCSGPSTVIPRLFCKARRVSSGSLVLNTPETCIVAASALTMLRVGFM